MGNEDPLFVLVSGAFTLLLIAILIFIPVKIVLLFVREWRRSRRR